MTAYSTPVDDADLDRTFAVAMRFDLTVLIRRRSTLGLQPDDLGFISRRAVENGLEAISDLGEAQKTGSGGRGRDGSLRILSWVMARPTRRSGRGCWARRVARE